MRELRCDVPDLEAELRRLLAQVPCGKVTTYGDLADALGARFAARWVGEFLRDHDHNASCPCHRVVRKDGALGLFLRGRPADEKGERLRGEGIRTIDGVVASFDEHVVRDFQSPKPLACLIEFQERIAERVRLEPYRATPRLVAGLDVSYSRDGLAVGTCAIVASDSGRLVWSATRRCQAPLPYLPGFLAFRELPVLTELFDEARRNGPPADLFLVDGNGILHPRGAGVATCFGVTADVPTIGVAKSLLCGGVEAVISPAKRIRPAFLDKSAFVGKPVFLGDKVVGQAVRWGRSARPLYVSPGQKTDVAAAGALVAALNFGHRLPEPLYWADRLSRSDARRSMV